jgi:hypothetical protein
MMVWVKWQSEIIAPDYCAALFKPLLVRVVAVLA